MRIASLALILAAFASGASAQSLVGLSSCCPNEVVTIDTASGDTTRVAAIGTAQDGFIATVGSLVLDPAGGRAFMVRNGRVAEMDFATGTVVEGPTATDWIQLAGFDDARGRLYAFATTRDTLDTAQNLIFRNFLVAYDAATQDTTRLLQIGEYTILNDVPSGDTFATVTGPAVASASTLYTIRNGRMLNVDLASGAIAEGSTPLELPEMVGTDATSVYWTSREVTGSEAQRTYTGRLLRQPISGGPDAVPDTVGVFAEATVNSATGETIGDVYLASFGVAFYDRAGDRILLNRNGRLVQVPLAAPSAQDLGPVGRIRYVPSASGLSTASEPTPEAGLSLVASPNPASGAVSVSLAMDAPGSAEVAVFDALGRRVALLHDGPLATGTHTLTWSASEAAAGVYVIRAQTPEGAASVRVTQVR